jgi:hypothetical protein
MGIPKQASIAESSGIWFCVFRDQALRALHSRMEYIQEDNCVVFAEWMTEELIEVVIYSIVICCYAVCIYIAVYTSDITFLGFRENEEDIYNC